MTTWPPSDSDRSDKSPLATDAGSSRDASTSHAFEQLDERVKQWIWDADWNQLRDIQEEAILSILSRRSDLIVAAATAAGKTEAVFLPICSSLVGQPKSRGLRVLYVSPLKALINDQFRRLGGLCEPLEIPVHRWHGDVPSSRKRQLIQSPSGILLITPESLEALFVVHGPRMGDLLAGLEWVVVDELHAFLGTDRGRQLQSLLHRLELRIRRSVPRIGLSATLGDLSLAAESLRPGKGHEVERIVSDLRGQELRLQIRGYTTVAPPTGNQPTTTPAEETEEDGAAEEIADHLFRTLRGQDHLVFANSRGLVEQYADRLRRRSDLERVPNEFLPHHGSLSRPLREEVEDRLKDSAAPLTAICTSTLELGIDIGQVTSIGQIGAPFSVASLRQRLGRSGRRGEPAILRLYIREPEITPRSHVLDGLRTELVQAVAMVELLVERWCEPAGHGALHLSVLVQQILSMTAEHGGVSALQLWRALCESGPFRSVSQRQLGLLLRSMGSLDLLMQADDGTLLPGEKGERILGHFTFYTIFQTPDEYQVIHQGQALGFLNSAYLFAEGIHIIFAGRRWKVVSVDAERKTILVVPSPGGRTPTFLGNPGGQVHDRVRTTMRRVWESAHSPRYLDPTARLLLDEGRIRYAELGLVRNSLVSSGRDTIVFLCRGDGILRTLQLQFLERKVDVARHGPALVLDGIDVESTRQLLEDLREKGPVDPVELAQHALNKRNGKYSWVLDESLLDADFASAMLDARGTHAAVTELLGQSSRG